MDRRIPTIVIIGAGFAGLNALKELSKANANLLIIDKNNFHTFYPLLYQVSTAELSAEQIGYPIRSLLRGKDKTKFLMGEVTNLDPKENTITINTKEKIDFDYAIIGLGTEPHYFGIEGAEEFSFTLDNLAHAELLRNQILTCFEKASRSTNPEEIARLLNFAIIGAGPTGIEYASSLSELIHGPLKKDFPGINMDQVSITIIEALDKVIPAFDSVKLSEYTRKRLTKLKIDVLTETRVAKVKENSVEMSNGEFIETDTTIWTAGVKAPVYLEHWDLPLHSNGQIEVDEYLRVKNFPTIYAVGDVAYVEDKEGNNLPLLAPVAIQQGKYAGRHIRATMTQNKIKSFKYKNRGSLVVLGRYSAISQLWGREFSGFFAWLLWGIVHIAQLIGFRNKLMVMINWFWNYLFFEKVERIIV